MPRLTSRPARRPSSTFGRMPAATTTRSASMRSPSANSTPSTLPLPTIAFVLRPSSTRTPSARSCCAAARRRGVHLPLHQGVHQVHDRDVAALHLEAARRLEAEQPAADHGRLRAAAGRASSARVSSSVRNARRRRDRARRSAASTRSCRWRAAARRRRDAAVGRRDRLLHRIDVGDPRPDAQLDAVLAIPVERVQRDLVGRLLAGQHRRQQDAVVVDVGFVAEDRDVELRRVLQDLLDAGDAGHAVADDDERSLPVNRRSTPGLGACSTLGSRALALATGDWRSGRSLASAPYRAAGRSRRSPSAPRAGTIRSRSRALVASHTACRLRAPFSTASTMRVLVMPLQSQMRGRGLERGAAGDRSARAPAAP